MMMIIIINIIIIIRNFGFFDVNTVWRVTE